MAALEIVVLAAGQGKRMCSGLPKVLHPLAGRPLLGHVLSAAATLAPRKVHVVHGHGGEQVRAAFAEHDLTWVHQAEQRGTGHAVREAMPGVADDSIVLVLFGDVPLVDPEVLRAAVAAASDALVVVSACVDDASGYGRIVRDENGHVAAIREDRDASAAERRITEYNTGIMAAPAARLRGWLHALRPDNAQGELYLTDAVRQAQEQGVPVRTVRAPVVADVAGVNDRRQLAALERVYQRRQADRLMYAGVSFADPDRFDARGDVQAQQDVWIDVNVVLEGRIRLGRGVRIEPNCLLRDVEVGADVQILANTVIEGAVIGAGSRVGPFARLRPETVLAAGVRVGNFVEVKKSNLAAGAKVNHLSYVGDSDIGQRVNVGAGTITCNYDGANKHRTVIGDDAFIGSGTELVAPIEIGAGATIGAGSTISREAPAGALTLTRAERRSVAGWKRPVKKPPR